MKTKHIILSMLLTTIIFACFGCQMNLSDSGHTHSFSEWEIQSPADCDSAAIEVRRCSCGEEEIREGAPASGHNFTAISARCLLESPMADMVITPNDLQVLGTCACGNVVITDGIEVEGGTLVLGENTIIVRYGALSTDLPLHATELDIALDAIITDDTCIASGDKDSEYSSGKSLGINSDYHRSYFRVNVGEILKTEMFTANAENAKVQLILSITAGFISEDTTVTVKVFDPMLPECDTDFSKLTWNSVDNKEGAQGAYANLHWHNGIALVSDGAGHNVQLDSDHIVVTLAYSQIAEFIDEEGNILIALATNTEDLEVGSLENKTASNHPVFKIILNGEHFHVFDREVAEQAYLISAGCKTQAKYYVSCVCGAAGTDTFVHGDMIDHTYSELIPKRERTCTADGVKAHYRCSSCGKYFLEKDGQIVVTSEAYLIIPAGHNCGALIGQKDPTCTETGMKAHYRCDRCKKYFVEVNGQKVEVAKEDLTIPKLEHTLGELIPKQERTCTEDGLKAHYRCSGCGKYFVEKDGQKIATSAESLIIPAGHNCGALIGQKDPTCTETGMKAHYRCDRCKKYFVEVDGQKVEVAKEDLTIPKLEHTLGELIPKQERTCTEDGLKAHYRCSGCGKYFVEKDGQKIATSAESLIIPAGHNFGALIAQKDPTCTETGMKAHYRCDRCKKYFVEVDGQKVEVAKEDLIIPATGHSLGDLVPKKEKTCTEDGLKAHYRCSSCGKYFVEKDGNQVATSEKSLKISAGHDMVMKWDDTHHWEECSLGCGCKTEPEAHCGGTATETEQAKCEVCGQYYV